MKCLKCSTQMKERDGKFGKFLFCPDQHTCGMKTVSVPASSNDRDLSVLLDDLYSKHYLLYELEVLESKQMEIFKETSNDYYNELGDPVTIDGGEIYEDPSHWRPY